MTNKSINASERLETPVLSSDTDWYDSVFLSAMGYVITDQGYWALNADASGINPTQSLETAVQ
jgi:hypothetical protein